MCLLGIWPPSPPPPNILNLGSPNILNLPSPMNKPDSPGRRFSSIGHGRVYLCFVAYGVRIFFFLKKANNKCNSLFVSLQEEAHRSNEGLVLEGRICSYRCKFFPLRVDPFSRKEKLKYQNCFPKIVPMNLNKK